MAEETTRKLGMPPAAESMVPVKVLRGYWPRGPVEGLTLDPERKKLVIDTLCMLPEGEAQDAADKGIVRILTPSGYRAAQEAAAQAKPPEPRTLLIPKV